MYTESPLSDAVYSESPLSDAVYIESPLSDAVYIESPLSDASAHERFFAAAVKQPQRPSISWLCARKVKETLLSQISSLSVSVCCMDFVESVAVCALLLRTRAKRRKRFWVHPLVSQRLLKGQSHKLYDLRIHPKKFFGHFRMTCSSIDELSSTIRPKITYRNNVMRASVPPEEGLAVTLR